MDIFFYGMIALCIACAVFFIFAQVVSVKNCTKNLLEFHQTGRTHRGFKAIQSDRK
jgi:hypothetical protein